MLKCHKSLIPYSRDDPWIEGGQTILLHVANVETHVAVTPPPYCAELCTHKDSMPNNISYMG